MDKNTKKIFVLLILLFSVVVIIVYFINFQSVSTQQIKVENAKYTHIELADVKSYIQKSVTDLIIISGTVVGINKNFDTYDLVLNNGKDVYVSVTYAHAFRSEFNPIFSKLKIGDEIEVAGIPGSTPGVLENSSNGDVMIQNVGVNLGTAPRLGMISLTDIQKVSPKFSEMSITEESVESWGTYRNTELGFEFKYPQNIFFPPRLLSNQYSPNEPEYLSEVYLCRRGSVNNQSDSCLESLGENLYLGPLIIRLDRDGEYTTYNYQRKMRETSTEYREFIIDGKDTFIFVPRYRNDIETIKLNDGYFISSISLNKMRDTCATNSAECGYMEIIDPETKALFNEIIATFKFIK